jgi:hypothetical protein
MTVKYSEQIKVEKQVLEMVLTWSGNHYQTPWEYFARYQTPPTAA